MHKKIVVKKKKSAITLLEIMIVIFLIGLIGSVIGYNVKGSLEEGKAFRSEQGAARLRDILLMEVANGTSAEEVVSNPKFYVKKSGLVSNPDKLLKDGWGHPYEIVAKNEYDLDVESKAYERYKAKKNKMPSPKEKEMASGESEE